MSYTLIIFICRFLDCDPVVIDAAWLSAQRRTRLFWGNIPGLKRKVEDSHSKLTNCLIEGVNRKPVVKKIRTVTTSSNSLRQGRSYYTSAIKMTCAMTGTKK
jgi:hypothetical protein